MRIIICILMLLPPVAQAELFKCMERDHMILQSFPCDAVIMRPPENARPKAQPLLVAVPTSATKNTTGNAPTTEYAPTRQPELSDEMRLWLKAMSR